MAFLLPVTAAQAVLLYSTGDPAYNTNAPTRSLTNSGWQYQGGWVGYSGTVISSNCFITTKHVGGAVGDVFLFQGVAYPARAAYDDPDSALRIWQVDGWFPTNAPLYAKRKERGKSVVVIGRGTLRGAEVRLNNKLKGWEWGEIDGVQRWGQNKVAASQDGGVGVGEVLRMAFNAGARNEAQLSTGDSGGAIFIKDGRIFKLAGINYGVDGPYNTTNSGAGFQAALFDQRGFYVRDGLGGWMLVPSRGGKIPSAFYATRISSRIDWINSVLAEAAP
jgi:hypothetical protein